MSTSAHAGKSDLGLHSGKSSFSSVLLTTAPRLPTTRRESLADRSFASLPGAVRHPYVS